MYPFTKKSYFIINLKTHQGIIPDGVTDELIETLDTLMFEYYDFPHAEEIREMPKDEYGRRGCPKASVKVLVKAFKITANSIFISNTTSICSNLWGWTVPSVDVPAIIDRYDGIEKICQSLLHPGDVVNSRIVLYYHLRMAGYKCIITDFYTPNHTYDVFEDLYEAVKLKYPPFV